MESVSGATVQNQLQWRYAVKKFDAAKKISAADWNVLEQSLVLAPSSFGLQPWKFIVVKNPAIREQLLPLSWGQRQVVEASHFVVLAAKKNVATADVERLINRISAIRGAPAASLEQYKGMMTGFVSQPGFDSNAWAARQVYIALGQFMSAAAMMGIDTCPMEGITPPKFDEILGLGAEGYGTVVACAAGYRAADDAYATAKKVRFESSDLIRSV